MEFTGSIQFADESSWLTLTTESDDTVTITVKFGSRILASQEVLSFDVAPNSGIVRLPAGEILGALMGNGIGMVTGSFTATQGSSSCSYSFSVLPCRKFAYKSLAATIFTTRPTKSPAYEGAEDRLYFYRTSGDVSTYVRFDYLDGGSSTSYKLSPTYYVSTKYYDLDISTGTMLSTAASKGLDTSKITGFKIWIEYSGSKSETYSFEIRRTRLPLKTYKFLGRRGTYEYIHATGKFSRSIESETQVFVNSGIEQELENDYSMTFEQNSGHIDSIGMNGYWLEFLAAKERYIIEKDGSERAIVVDEFKTSLTDRTVSSMTFKWHYANPNNTVIDKVDIDITGLGILGPSTVNDVSNTAQFQVTYSPSNTTQRSITWSVVSGSDYASIDEKGLLTVKGRSERFYGQDPGDKQGQLKRLCGEISHCHLQDRFSERHRCESEQVRAIPRCRRIGNIGGHSSAGKSDRPVGDMGVIKQERRHGQPKRYSEGGCRRFGGHRGQNQRRRIHGKMQSHRGRRGE